MEAFDKEQYINNIYSEFNKTDEFYDEFRKKFIFEINTITASYYPDFDKNSFFSEALKLYADEILSTAESVIYKDISYPEYRIHEELELMTRLIVTKQEELHNQYFIEDVHLKAKELIVKYYPDVINLSGNGFRLLEKYTKMYNWEFVSNFYGSNR